MNQQAIREGGKLFNQIRTLNFYKYGPLNILWLYDQIQHINFAFSFLKTHRGLPLMMRVKSLTQTLKFCFSNPPKNIPKPSPIEFDFKIPKKPSPSAHLQSQSEVKILKAKRQTDLNKLLKKKKEGEQYKSKIESSYQQQQQQKIQQNLKTIRYHQDEYFKGQHLIQNIPLDPFYSYKLADFERKMEMQTQKIKQFIGPYVNYDLKAEAKFKIAELYHEKQQKYEVEEFLRYLDQYPGSPKGPKPQDDLDYFVEYAYKKIPPILAARLSAQRAEKELKIKKNSNDLEGDIFRIPQEDNYSSFLNFNRSLEKPLQKDLKRDLEMQKTSAYPIFKEYEEIPQVPELQFSNYHQYMKELMNWRNFKNYYVQKTGMEQVQKQLDFLYKVEEENDPEPDNEYYLPSGKAPSLLRYYKTLPKHIQDHPGLKDIVLGLEFLCPHIPYEEKEQAINFACTLVLPLDKVSHRAMSDFIEKKKEYLTPFMTQKIFTINPEYTWDINQFFAQIKRQQLKGQSMIKTNETAYPEPPQVHLDWEDGTANLPIDFYDNDDGFWDEIISEKLKRQDQAKPMMKVRQHFYH